MLRRTYERISIDNIVPEGFMDRQLRVQAEGLTGNIDSIWEDLSDNSAWLNGKGEAWERGPYYIDGLITLSFLLNDEALKHKAMRWIDSIIGSQIDSGFFGPAWNKDWWPRMVVLKALVPYYQATGDERVIPFMERYFRYQYDNIDVQPPSFWAAARALEAAEAIELVYSETKKEYLIELAKKLNGYTYDWKTYFLDLPYKKPMDEYINKKLFNFFKNIGEPFDRIVKRSTKVKKLKSADKIIKFNNNNTVKLISLTHGVNIAMALKYPVTFGLLAEETDLFKVSSAGYKEIMKYHGTAIGLWTSDEHLSGPNPSNGTELCVVVEMMYSLEEMLSITGDVAYADLLEFLAYNALPATFTPDMCAHQYVQQPNQIEASKKRRQFFDADKEANTYGLEPNFGCCAANMHQGFPKFAANACYVTDEGLAFMVYMPCSIKSVTASGKRISIKESGSYPYGDKIQFIVTEGEEIDITMLFRVPEGTEAELIYNGDKVGRYKAGVMKLNRIFNKGDEIEILIDAPIRLVTNPDNSVSIRKGVLLLALKIEEEYKSLRGKEPFNYREYFPLSRWNLAPIISQGKIDVLSVEEREIPKLPFDAKNPPLSVKVMGTEVLNWEIRRNSAGKYPLKPITTELFPIELVPYGSTNIRISQFPVIKAVVE